MSKSFIKTHEWFEQNDGSATVGISKFAAAQLGDVTFIEFPEVGARFEAGALIGSIESVKAASDLFTPIAGTVTEINSALIDQPELVNADPEGAGWLFRLGETGAAAEELMDEAAYETFIQNA